MLYRRLVRSKSELMTMIVGTNDDGNADAGGDADNDDNAPKEDENEWRRQRLRHRNHQPPNH